jgi:hypothetical protein
MTTRCLRPRFFSNHSFSFRVFIFIEMCKYIFASQVALAPTLSVFLNIFIFTFLFIYIFMKIMFAPQVALAPSLSQYTTKAKEASGKAKDSQKCCA